MSSAIYSMRVMHTRHIEPFYRFVYRVFYLYLDIDRLDAIARPLRLLSINRFNLLSFHNRDHGTHTDAPLRPWVEQHLADVGVTLDDGRIQILCLPRILGYVFNPISLYYCHHADGELRAVVVEVHNTFGEMHGYLIHAAGQPLDLTRAHDKQKQFHVSPFLDVRGDYRFTMDVPDTTARLVIEVTDNNQPVMTAAMHGRARALTDASIAGQVLAIPLATLKVTAAIHWQALKLWIRGAGYRTKPTPPRKEMS